MTGFLDCLTTATVRGLLDEGKAAEARTMFDDMVRELKETGMSEHSAAIKAAEQATERVGYQVERQKKMIVLGNTARNRVLAEMRAYRTPKGEESFANAAINFIERDEYGTSSGFYGRREAIKSAAHMRMANILDKFQPQKAGLVRPKAGMDNMLEEIFAQKSKRELREGWRDTIDGPTPLKTGDVSAKEMADAWRDTSDYLRERANLAGSDIKVREDWKVPISWDWARVSKMGKKGFTDFIMQHANFARMFDHVTGESMDGLDEMARREALGKAFDTIKTQGYINLDGVQGEGGSLADRMGQSRFIQIKDAASWKVVNETLGTGSVFDAMINHIDHMTQQIAMLETFGPNPEMMRRYIKTEVRKRAAMVDAANPDPAKYSHVASEDITLRKFDAMWGTINNQNSLLNGDWMGLTLAGTRNMLTAAHLGSASLVAIPGDFLSVAMTKKFNNLDGNRFIKDYLKLMNPADDTHRKAAVRLGLIADAATSIAYGQQRLLGQITGPQFTKRIADVVMRASLMTPHTQAARWAFGMEFLGALADHSQKAFDEVPFKNSFKRYGITSQDWEAIRKTPLHIEQGATFLRPDDIMTNSKLPPSQAQALADKLMEMVLGEARVAVQEPTIRARSALIGDSKPGTLIGELGRSAAMFKNFAISLLMIHQRRNLLNHAAGGSKFGYAAAFGLGLTAMGALSIQLRQISQGKDPQNMNPATPEGRKFWGAAALAGGGLGLWGDFLFNDVNRFGGGPAESAAGPVVSFLGDTAKLTTGNMLEVAQGKDTKILPEMVQYTRRYMPGGSLWYARLLLQREVFDQLQEAADPKAHQKWRKQQNELRKQYKQNFYWRPGDALPSRPPDLGAAVKK